MTFFKEHNFNTFFSFKNLLLLNTILIFGIVFFLPARFEENDDVVMMLFSSGGYTGHPESYLVFVNYFYGFILSGLYQYFPRIEWYTLFFLVIHILSLSVISRSIVKKQSNAILVSVFLLLVYLIELKFLLNIQFTTTAAVAAFSGLILISKDNLKHRFCGVFLFVLASLIRFEVSILVFSIMLPLFYNQLISGGKLIYSRKNNLILCALVLVLSLKFIDYKLYNKSDDWSYYYEYNRLRGLIYDNPNNLKIIDNLPPTISNSDYLLLINAFSDQSLMNLDKLKLIDNSLKDLPFTSKTANFITQISKYLVLLFFVVALWSIVFFKFSSRNSKFILFFSLFIFLSILFYITLNGILKTRVFLTAFLPFIYLIYINIDLRKQKFFNIALCANAVFLMLIFGLLNFRTYNLNDVSKDAKFQEQMSLFNKYFEKNSEKVVLYGGDFNIQKISPFKLNQALSNKIILTGWTTSIPYNKETFNSYLNLINAYPILMTKSNKNYIFPLIAENIKSHYGIDVESQKIVESEHYVIFKLVNN